jgi:iron complex outermembrane recepter protein
MLCLFIGVQLQAQVAVQGKVVDAQKNPIPYATVVEKGKKNATVADANGNFYLSASTATPTLVITAAGFKPSESVFAKGTDIELAVAVKSYDDVTIVGSRSSSRTKVNTIAPVDVINVREVTSRTGQLDLNQLLQFAAPSFNSNRQSGSDGADHIDPATLRGMGPDQTLVLLNGKRYHQSSLVNLYGSRGRGNNGTDLNTIPAAAIERIEILRDGAAAQYGSDAIAGVINIVLKSGNTSNEVNAAVGAHNAKYRTDNKSLDGLNYNVSYNKGFSTKNGGFLNMTLDVNSRNHTNRANTESDPNNIARREFGDPKVLNTSLFLNGKFPLDDKAHLYIFGGVNRRSGEAFAWTRSATDSRNVAAIYPNGFDPIITSGIFDHSITAGFKTKMKAWDFDFSGTFGGNKFDYGVKNTLNTSLGASSPKTFEAGGFALNQNTFNMDFKRKVDYKEGLNVATGIEVRNENYVINAGEEKSYKSYVAGVPPGSQGFPGFQPSDEVNASRLNLAYYLDLETQFTKNFTLASALRFENYDDFGGTANWKLAGRYQLSPMIAVRATASTGFRAPSLPQINFNSTITNFIAGTPVEVLVARNNSKVAQQLGIPALKQERSRNFSYGFTYSNKSNFSLTVDGYAIQVKDRIVLTGQFSDTDPDVGALLTSLNVGKAQLFTNAIGTTTTGVDVVASHTARFKNSRLITSLAINKNLIKINDVYTNTKLAGKEDIYFDLREKYFVQESAPRSKMNLGFDYSMKKLTTSLRFVYFDEVALANWNYDPTSLDVYEKQFVTDLSLTYKFAGNVQATIGANNLLNVYPTLHNPLLTESGGAWDPVQMGYNGRFMFAKLRVNL